MNIDYCTTLEESIRKLRGISYMLTCLAYNDLDPDQSDMYELLANNIDSIIEDLEPLPETIINLTS